MRGACMSAAGDRACGQGAAGSIRIQQEDRNWSTSPRVVEWALDGGSERGLDASYTMGLGSRDGHSEGAFFTAAVKRMTAGSTSAPE